MGFNKPNDPAAGVNPAATAIQAQLDSLDLAILAAGSMGTGVLSGCAVTQRAAGANMSVDVAAGVASVQGTAVNVTAVNMVIAGNGAGNPRLDLICVNASGTVIKLAGTAAAAPDYPLVTSDGDGNLLRAVLAVVYVAAGATSIVTANLTDLRVTLNAGDILDTSTINTDTPHFAQSITDNTTYAHNQTGSLDNYAALVINGNPIVPAGKNLPYYAGLLLESGPTSVAGTIGQHMALAAHWDAPVGVTTALAIGGYFHVGSVGGVVTKARGLMVELLQFSGAINQGTGFYFMASQAQKTFGMKIGGVDGDYGDHWPSYHMGPLALGGTPTAGVDGGLFNPIAALDVRELRQLVYTIPIVLNGTVNITVDSTSTVGIFDYLFDGSATITGTGIPGGTTLTSVTPTTAVMSAAATASGTVTATITKSLPDENASALRLTPAYDGAATVVRHNYMRFNRPTLTNGAAVTDAAAFHFPVAFASHEALAAGTTKTTPGGVDGWVKLNIAGTIYFVPAYASKTA